MQSTCLDSSVGRVSAFGAGGHGFKSGGRTIPNVYFTGGLKPV